MPPLLTRNPAMLDAQELLAKSLTRMGRTREAIEAFGRVLAIEPLKPETHLALARILRARARSGARPRARRARGQAATPPPATRLLAELMMDAGRTAEAAAFARAQRRGRSVALHEPLSDRRRRAARRTLRRTRSRRSGEPSTPSAPSRRRSSAISTQGWRTASRGPARRPKPSASSRRSSPRCRGRRRDESGSRRCMRSQEPRRRSAHRARRPRRRAAAADRRRVLDSGARLHRARRCRGRARVGGARRARCFLPIRDFAEGLPDPSAR